MVDLLFIIFVIIMFVFSAITIWNLYANEEWCTKPQMKAMYTAMALHLYAITMLMSFLYFSPTVISIVLVDDIIEQSVQQTELQKTIKYKRICIIEISSNQRYSIIMNQYDNMTINKACDELDVVDKNQIQRYVNSISNMYFNINVGDITK